MKRYLLVILGILLIISLLIGTSYAYWINTHVQKTNNYVSSGCFSIDFKESSDSLIKLNNTYPISDTRGMQLKPYKFTIENTCDIYAIFNVNIEILESSSLSSNLIKTVINNNIPKVVTEYQSAEPITTGAQAYTLTSGGLEPSQSKSFEFRMWLTESATLSEAEGKTANVKITVVSAAIEKPTLADACSNGVALSQCIIDFYEKYGEGNNGLYFHDNQGIYADSEAGDNSYRYSGANPDNYICFGTNDEICPSSNLYRIIGVFNGKVKLVKNTTYQNNYWGGSNSNSDNNWSNSALNTSVLNGEYLTSLGSFSDMISESTWSVGGINNGQRNTNASSVYNYEVGNLSTNKVEYQAKIGLIYISDFGFATSPNYWNTPLNSYNNQSVTNNTWLFNRLEWTITRQSDSSSHAYFIDGSGLVFGDLLTIYNIGVRPAFYLNELVQFDGGRGSTDNPYRISTN